MKRLAGILLCLLCCLPCQDVVAKKGNLPEMKYRALDYLLHPHWYSNLDLGDFKYSHHTCQERTTKFVCTACYSHPKGYLGTLSVACPTKEGAECALLLLPQALKDNGVDLAYCEKSANSH